MDNELKPTKNQLAKKIFAGVILFLILLGIVAGTIICWNAIFNNSPILTPDFALSQEEKYAENIGNDNDSKLPQPEGGGAVSLTYSTDISISLTEEKAYLYFENPTKSNQDMILQIVIQDTIVAQSGKLVPGKQVYKLDLLKNAASKLSPGGYNGKFVILYYQKDTGEKAVINTDIPVTINVKT